MILIVVIVTGGEVRSTPNLAYDSSLTFVANAANVKQ